MPMTRQQREAARTILAKIDDLKVDDRVVADVFQELPPKKDLPDYYQVIKKPMALDSVKVRARNGRYVSFASFISDLAQIFHNAKLYNTQKSIIHTDAIALEELLNEELANLNKAGTTTLDKLPVMGNIPDGSDEEDEAMDDAASSDDEQPTATTATRDDKDITKPEPLETPIEDGRASPTQSKKRGRPPKVETPDEGRMKNVLKAIHKVQRDDKLLFEPFEKLPDAKEYPDYYEHIKAPMSLALVKKNIKKKVYAESGINGFLEDVKTIFNNAKLYNEDGSSIHDDANYLLQELDGLVKAEITRPDGDFLTVDVESKSLAFGTASKLARKGVSEILLRGETYKVGDWIYLHNSNDAAWPTVAQIFRTWQNSDGEYWINACWYYRPHQTVHRADKLWAVREVVKTGQYRDHAAQDIAGRCYVMYVTKYVRGRPREWTGPEEDLYVCENRYNEELKTYNKIKAWKSCVPEQAREQCSGYEMDLFKEIKSTRKVLSPLLYLMPEEKSLWVNPVETEDNPIKAPEPRDRGASNGPPKEGNLIITSVPDERTVAEINGDLKPEGQQSQQQQQTQRNSPLVQRHTSSSAANNASPYEQATPGRPASTNPPQTPVGTQGASASTTPHFPPGTYQPIVSRASNPTTPALSRLASQQRLTSRATMNATPAPAAQTTPMQLPANTNKLNSLGSQVNPTAYVLIGSLGMSEGTKRRYLLDERGDVIWFSVPAQDSVVPEQRGRAESHSARYLAWKISKRRRVEEK